MATSESNKRIFLIGNSSKPGVPETFDQLRRMLQSKGLLAGSDLDCRLDQISASKPDMVIALGGDGTILAVGQALQHRQVPIIGVNMGKLGYLANFTSDELLIHFDQVLDDPVLVTRRMMLDVTLKTGAGGQKEGVALNDCVIRVAEPFRTVGLSVDIDDHPVTTIVSDGLIISTPTGSTAHNMSCGGPILQPDVEAIILTPLCPHSMTHRPVVVGPEAEVAIAVRMTSEGAAMVLDGHYVCPVPGGSKIEIRRSACSFLLVRNPQRDNWDTLVQKLKWGQTLT